MLANIGHVSKKELHVDNMCIARLLLHQNCAPLIREGGRQQSLHNNNRPRLHPMGYCHTVPFFKARIHHSKPNHITNRLREAGDLIGIPLLDHVILGEDSFVSLKERNLIP